MPLDQRRAGILLHPTSLPGRFGIGDLGPECIRFLDWAQDTGLAYWQILPLGPTGYGDSPYQCFSAFAGNPLLISLELLVQEGLLEQGMVDNWPAQWGAIDYGAVMDQKHNALHHAHNKFVSGGYIARLLGEEPAVQIAEDLQKFKEMAERGSLNEEMSI